MAAPMSHIVTAIQNATMRICVWLPLGSPSSFAIVPSLLINSLYDLRDRGSNLVVLVIQDHREILTGAEAMRSYREAKAIWREKAHVEPAGSLSRRRSKVRA